MDHATHIKNLSIVGGALCLDFINTVDSYKSESPIDYISTQNAWISWLKRNKFEVPKTAIQFNQKRIWHVRNVLYQLFFNLIEGKNLDKKLLNSFNKEIDEMHNYTVLRKTKQEASLQIFWNFERNNLDNYLFPIIKSAYNLIITPQMKKVKSCPNCGWLFLDNSKNQSRRWCDMKTCGNILKTRKYYSRKKNKHT